MKIYKILFIAIMFFMTISSCSTATVQKNVETKTADLSEVNINNNGKTEYEENIGNENLEDSDSVKIIDARKPDMSPTETYKAYNNAIRRMDVEDVTYLLSKSSVKMVEKIAKEQNTTIKNLLTINPYEREILDEKISGSMATVEIKNEFSESNDIMPFVKENGIWKVALDKFMDDMMKKTNENQRQAPEPNRK